MNLSEPKKVFLRKFFTAEIKPLMEDYWMMVFDKRANGDEFFLDSPLVDLFKPVQTEDPVTKERTLHCVIPLPDCRPFWEVIFAFYLIFREDLYHSPAHIAKMILAKLPEILRPENLSNDIMEFLLRLAERRDDLIFLQHPIEFVPSIKVLLLMSANFPQKVSELAKFNDQVELWKKQAYDEESVRLKDFEEEWLALKRS
jgi:hypothetical protein